jgi:hypothetical protein
MANNNIIEYSGLYTLTSSGTGDLYFSGTQLSYLYDGNTTSSGVTISGSDTLFLEANFLSRVLLNEVRIYLSSATSSGTVASNLNIEYKDSSGASYTTSGTGIGSGYYYADSTPLVFAPQYLRVSISGTECTIHEVIAYSDDDIVDFGTDGTLTELITEAYEWDTTPTAVPIYNDGDLGTDPVTAYVSLDYLNYTPLLKIGASETGQFYGVSDNIILEDDNTNNEYSWSQGYLMSTKVEDSNIKIDSPGFSMLYHATYTSYAVTSSGVEFWKHYNSNDWMTGHSIFDITRPSILYERKWYWEVKVVKCNANNNIFIGITRTGASSVSTYPGADGYGYSYYGTTGNVYYGGGNTAYGATYSGTDVIGVAFCVYNKTGYLFYSKNGVWQNSGDPVNLINPARDDIPVIQYSPYVYDWRPAVAGYAQWDKLSINYGQHPFEYSVPEGYSPVNNQNTLGFYSTPVFDMEDKYAQSYFNVDIYTASGTIIAVDPNDSIPSMEIQNSDTAPIAKELLFIPSFHLYDCTFQHNTCLAAKIETYTPYTDDMTSIYTWAAGFNIGDWWNRAVTKGHLYAPSRFNPRKGAFLQCISSYPSYTHAWVRSWDFTDSARYLYWKDERPRWDWAYKIIDYDGEDCWWGYSDSSGYAEREFPILKRISFDLETIHATIDFASSESLYCLSAEKIGAGVWYTEQYNNIFYHLDSAGNILQSITEMGRPRALCATSDDGCWVIDNQTFKAYLYDNDGNRVRTVNIQSSAIWMENDWSDGFWYVNDTSVNHVNSDGIRLVTALVNAPTRVSVGINHVSVYSESNDKTTLFDTDGNVVKEIYPDGIEGAEYFSVPTMLASLGMHNARTERRDYLEGADYPLYYDPVWGDNGSAEWITVPINSFAVPKTRYHRIRFTLSADDYPETPEIRSITSPKTIKVQDIYPKTSRNVYVKPEFAENSIRADQSIRLKTWWYIEK